MFLEAAVHSCFQNYPTCLSLPEIIQSTTFQTEFEFEFIDKQPMKAGQGLKSSLARKD